jgi:hypothetical protein
VVERYTFTAGVCTQVQLWVGLPSRSMRAEGFCHRRNEPIFLVRFVCVLTFSF